MDGLNGEEDRDQKGRFMPGCKPGPGRPRRETEREYFSAIKAECSVDQWSRIISKAVEQAIAGDHRARDWLTKHVLPHGADSLSVHESDDGMDALEQLKATLLEYDDWDERDASESA